MILVTVKVDWGQETIQEILPALRKHGEITLKEADCNDFFFAVCLALAHASREFLRSAAIT